MTRSDPSATYDHDFFAWTQAQATALRLIPKDIIGNHIDIEHVAEEIEDLGKRDLREVHSLLARLVEHLIKIRACPNATAIAHWSAEAYHFQSAAKRAFSPSMRRLLDADLIWRDGRKAAAKYLDETSPRRSILLDRALSQDDLLAPDFDLDHALSKIPLNEN